MEMLLKTMLNKVGESSALVTTGTEKMRYTVMLVFNANVQKFTPHTIFERKIQPKGTLTKSIHIHAQEMWIHDFLKAI